MPKPANVMISISLAVLGTASAASAHDSSEVRSELRDRGYYQFQFIVDEAPFQVNACRDGERFHLHIDWYGRISEQVPLGACRESWWRHAWHRSYDEPTRY
jgi:hypothetical protein